MGCSPFGVNDSIDQLKVATLNYSGILLSPYEFFQKNDEQQQKLNRIMKEVSQASNFQYQFGPFEKQWQKKRYSPLYVPTCGIKNNISMMSQKQFLQEWKAWLQSDRHQVQAIYNNQKKKVMDKQKNNPKDKKNQRKPNQFRDQTYYLDNLKKFDLAIYRVILEFVYELPSEKDQIRKNFSSSQNVFQLSATKYRKHRKQKFKKSFLNQSEKIKKTIKALQELSLDILFLQQATTQLVQEVQRRSNQYRIVKHCGQNSKQLDTKSVIFIRQKKFPKVKSLLEENKRITTSKSQSMNKKSIGRKLSLQQIKSFNLNNDTVVQMIYNLILICPHLTSKKEVNLVQTKELQGICKLLKQCFPECHIIIGGDLNNKNIKPFGVSINEKNHFFNVVPDSLNNFTAYKKRTGLQAQNKKANQVNQQTKDYIITDLEIKQAKIITVTGQQIANCKIKSSSQTKGSEAIFSQAKHGPPQNLNVSMLPTDSHPYDHFMVFAKIKLPNNGKLQHVTDKQYLFQYEPNKLKQQEILEIQNQRAQRNR